jgi:hypothetical protein
MPVHYTIRILQACPELGLQSGNLVTFEPDVAAPDYPLFVHRPFPANLGSLLLLLESGGAELLTPHSTVSDFAAAVGYPASLSADPSDASPPPPTPRPLRLEP